jgi:CRP/FNR family transcriptional regulator/CRP/FNR family cyclic AMP-dependent transcriptional regulator
MAHEDTLAAVPLFSQLGHEAITRLAKSVVSRKYGAGNLIMSEGEQAVAFYVVVSGKIEVSKGGHPLNTLGKGDFFGEMSLVDGRPRAVTLKALEDTECLVMARWDFMAELQNDAHMAASMLQTLSTRIRGLEEHILDLEQRIRELGG